jgi:NAD(P)-dependent dehydrogenase (short-subunit alcohol dehydrogenase family)
MTTTRKVLMITGAGRGIGAATARLAAARNHDLLLTWRGNQAAAEATAAACREAGAAVELVRADAGCEAETLAAFAALDARFGRIDGLVANAGITGPMRRLIDTSLADWDAVFRPNVYGLFLSLREAARRMSTARGGRGGAIVTLSSRAAEIGGAGEFIHYAASKGAVDTITVGFAREVAAEGIRVNAVNPGLIDTEIHAAAGAPDRIQRFGPMIPMGRGGSAEEVAEAILFLLSDAASYITGARLPVGGGR